MRGKQARAAETRRDRAALVAEAEAAKVRADKAEAELAEARATFERRLTAATQATAEAKRLMDEQSSPELRRAREVIEQQRAEVQDARDKLQKWGKYRKRFDGLLARVLKRNFDVGIADAKQLVAECWLTTAVDNEADFYELAEWMKPPRSVEGRAQQRGRLTPAQADALEVSRGRVNPSVRPHGGRFDETWGHQWMTEDELPDDDDESDPPAAEQRERSEPS